VRRSTLPDFTENLKKLLTDFVAASVTVDNDPAVILPRRARLVKTRERLCSHPDVEQAKYNCIALKAWDMKRTSKPRSSSQQSRNSNLFIGAADAERGMQ
jgi:hypothetical protein